MINKEVIPAFDMLLEELETIIPVLNDQGKKLMDQMKYPEARAVIAKAEAVIAFQDKVRALKTEWLSLEVPPTKPPVPPKAKKPTKKKVTRVVTTVLEVGKRTKNEDLRLPILQSLAGAGGKMRFQDLIADLEVRLANILTVDDWDPLPSNSKVIRWKNNVGWAKKPLLDAGYLSSMAPRGTWEITHAGRAALDESKKLINEQGQLYLPSEPSNKQQDLLPFEVGKIYHRLDEIHKTYGGNPQAGIAPSSKYPYIFLFNTPSGKEAGYQDGWVDQDTYYYTGQGQKGDMQFVLGNKAILNHQAVGEELHLFKKINNGNYEYLGQFKYQSHEILDGFDFDHQPRKIIRFTLKKL